MDARAHHEAQIKRFDPKLGDEFEDALTLLAYRNKLSWFTDEQIADIRDTMIAKALRQRRSAAASRKSYADAARARL